jgi:hypothetical protein
MIHLAVKAAAMIHLMHFALKAAAATIHLAVRAAEGYI